MASITDIVQSSGWKNFMAKLYGLGASVVIIGALFKIQHWAGAGIMLTIGLLTEAIIFFFSAFEPLHEELDWTLVYPELAGMSDPDDIEHFKDNKLSEGRPLEKIETLLGDVEISEESISKLGVGLTKLSKAAGDIADLAMATAATQEFIGNMQGATSSIANLNQVYTSSTDSIKQSAGALANSYLQSADIISKSGNDVASTYAQIAETIKNEQNNIAKGGKTYEEQVTSLNKSLTELNSIYELQVKDGKNHLEGSQQVYSGLGDMIKKLKESVDETNKYKEEIVKLRDSLSSLNNIYGNMLSAMNVMTGK
ncbi:MAG: gliding motility protein GldL [Bacteroidales bacterium]|nr:gliding motility protein GldL [Bacteroidales bacterium]